MKSETCWLDLGLIVFRFSVPLLILLANSPKDAYRTRLPATALADVRARTCTQVLYSPHMAVEGEPQHETVRPGQLYFLSHPGSALFSGYGLTTQAGRKDRLIGLLMVDRPHVVDPKWLAELEARYGDYHLISMTQTGERGILTQMHIAEESAPLLERFTHPVARDFTQALQPLLEDGGPLGAAPVLKLRWDAERKLWSSDFWVGLSPVLQEVFREIGYGVMAVELPDDAVSFVTHAPDVDIHTFHNAQVRYRWEFIPMPTAPLIRYRAAILVNPQSPYVLAHFLNVADAEQARCLGRLVKQAALTFDFFGDEYEYLSSKQIPHPAESRIGLQEIVQSAIAYYGAIPAAQRDFDRAKALFQRYFPV